MNPWNTGKQDNDFDYSYLNVIVQNSQASFGQSNEDKPREVFISRPNHVNRNILSVYLRSKRVRSRKQYTDASTQTFISLIDYDHAINYDLNCETFTRKSGCEVGVQTLPIKVIPLYISKSEETSEFDLDAEFNELLNLETNKQSPLLSSIPLGGDAATHQRLLNVNSISHAFRMGPRFTPLPNDPFLNQQQFILPQHLPQPPPPIMIPFPQFSNYYYQPRSFLPNRYF